MGTESKNNSINIVVLSGLLACIVVSIVILAAVPPVSRDALIHHLAIPKLYLKHGGIFEIPSSEFSYYPMNLEMLYLIPLYFGNDVIPKFIHFIFALFTSWLIFIYVKKRISTTYALIGAMFFLSTPIIVKLSITAYVDLGLIFFSIAAILSLFKWVEGELQHKFLVIAALCCGFGLGTKYNGLILFVFLVLLVPYIYLKKVSNSLKLESSKSKDESTSVGVGSAFSQWKSLGYVFVFMVVALIIFSPWAIKNFFWTDNPIYPLFDNWFNPARISASDSSHPIGHFGWRTIVFNESWWEICLIPLRIFFQGQDDNPQYFDGQLNPFFLFLPFFALLRHSKNIGRDPRQEIKILLFFAVFYLLVVFFQTDMRIRYIAPIIAPLVILSTFGLHRINSLFSHRYADISPLIGKSTVVALCVIILGMNVAYIYKQYQLVNPFSYITGKVTRDEYIERYRPAYAAIRYANQNLPENAEILCFFLRGRRYYSDRKMLFDEGIFQASIQNATEPSDIAANLVNQNISHFLIRFDIFYPWLDRNFSDKERSLINTFSQNHLSLLFSKGGYGLFQLTE